LGRYIFFKKFELIDLVVIIIQHKKGRFLSYEQVMHHLSTTYAPLYAPPLTV
jgi:hypothetical protein